MDFSSIPLFSQLYTKLTYTGERQSVLAQTLSNLDTPGYQPKDLAPLDFGKMAHAAMKQQLPMAATSPLHLSGVMAASGNRFNVMAQRDPFEKKPVKNSVTLEEQMMKIAENAADHQKATMLYRKVASMFRIVIGNR